MVSKFHLKKILFPESAKQTASSTQSTSPVPPQMPCLAGFNIFPTI